MVKIGCIFVQAPFLKKKSVLDAFFFLLLFMIHQEFLWGLSGNRKKTVVFAMSVCMVPIPHANGLFETLVVG